MQHILADILSLIQHVKLSTDEPVGYRLEHCLCCGSQHPQRYGYYPRKADRTSHKEHSLNPILIQRFFCLVCERTCSVLPECIPPRRWYLWEIQQIALVLLLAGKSLRAAAQEITPSRRTISRWFNRFKEQYRLHKDVLCNIIADLGRAAGFEDFWKGCLKEMLLAKAMRLCHVAGVPVP